MNNMPTRSTRPPRAPRSPQRGVVLIISLIMLVILSMLATLSIRNATSSESVSGNARTTLLATQAAEMALRYCEQGLVQAHTGALTPLDPTQLPTRLPYVAGTTPRWKTLSIWDNASADVFVVPSTVVNHDAAAVTYARAPECMVEHLRVVNSVGNFTDTSTYVITARGFGPDETGASNTRPTGSEAWMQSTVELN